MTSRNRKRGTACQRLKPGLPDGHTRAVVMEPPKPVGTRSSSQVLAPTGLEPLSEVLRRHRAEIPVATRPLTDYAHATQPATQPAEQNKPMEESR